MVLNTIKQKDEMINFLQAHVSQLTQSISQFAIKPGDEEIKKKGLVAVLEMSGEIL